MRDGSSSPLPRVIVYVFATPELPGTEDLALGADVDGIFAQEALELVERVIDRGPPKRRRSQYPVLARLARGEADALLIVRSPLYSRGAIADRLESAATPGPFAWLSPADLQAAGLLPPPTEATRSRPTAPRPAKRRPGATTALPTESSPSPR